MKPVLIYHSENPRAFKTCDKSKLPVVWRSNKKGWMTSKIFNEWLNGEFLKSITKLNDANNVENKVLLIVDNAPSYALIQIPENIKIVFVPPNTTPLLQPMDLGVIANFKAYYLRRVFKNLIEYVDGPAENTTIIQFWKRFNIKDAVDNIVLSWNEVKGTTLNSVWKKLWPECVWFQW